MSTKLEIEEVIHPRLPPFLIKKRIVAHRPNDGSSFSYKVQNFWVRKLFKENHGSPIYSSAIQHNIVATCSKSQVNIYDTVNYGNHFDFFLQYNVPEPISESEHLRAITIPNIPSIWNDVYVVFSGDSGTVSILSVRSRKITNQFHCPLPIISIASYPGRPSIVVLLHSTSVTIWNIFSSQWLHQFSFGPSNNLRAISIISENPTTDILCISTSYKIFKIELKHNEIAKYLISSDKSTVDSLTQAQTLDSTGRLFQEALLNLLPTSSNHRGSSPSTKIKQESPLNNHSSPLAESGFNTFTSWGTVLSNPSTWHSKPIDNIILKYNSNGLVLISKSRSGKVILTKFPDTNIIIKQFSLPNISAHSITSHFTTDSSGDWFACGNDAGDLVFHSLTLDHNSIAVTPSQYSTTPTEDLLREKEEQFRTSYRDKSGKKIDYDESLYGAYHIQIHRKSKHPITSILFDFENRSIYTTYLDGSIIVWNYIEQGFYDTQYRSKHASFYNS